VVVVVVLNLQVLELGIPEVVAVGEVLTIILVQVKVMAGVILAIKPLLEEMEVGKITIN
jgi:hypothetical protein